MLAYRSVRPGAVTELDLAPVEPLEFGPFVSGNRPVFCWWPLRPAPVEEFLVVPHNVIIEHG